MIALVVSRPRYITASLARVTLSCRANVALFTNRKSFALIAGSSSINAPIFSIDTLGEAIISSMR
jgi:hypothetical protein